MPKVMVLEDETILYQLLHDLLSFEGFEVLEPSGLDTAVDEMRAAKPSALILDVHLKGFNGLDLLDEIRNDKELKGMYVLATSGLDHAQDAKQHGADDFIMKPYMPDELVQLLQNKIRQ
jgi:DNA-binding response OmpR family regulator